MPIEKKIGATVLDGFRPRPSARTRPPTGRHLERSPSPRPTWPPGEVPHCRRRLRLQAVARQPTWRHPPRCYHSTRGFHQPRHADRHAAGPHPMSAMVASGPIPACSHSSARWPWRVRPSSCTDVSLVGDCQRVFAHTRTRPSCGRFIYRRTRAKAGRRFLARTGRPIGYGTRLGGREPAAPLPNALWGTRKRRSRR